MNMNVFSTLQIMMTLQIKSPWLCFHRKIQNCLVHTRSCKSKKEWKKLRFMIVERTKNRAKYYPVPYMVPVAREVMKARAVLLEGVSKLMTIMPVKACRHCSEIFVGHIGHHIRTCQGHKRGAKNLIHDWIEGNINDIIVPVETFHLYDMFQDVIKHDERFDFDRIPAVVELCIQAGVDLPEYPTNRTSQSLGMNNRPHVQSSNNISDNVNKASINTEVLEASSHLPGEICALAGRTLQAWETMRLGIKKLMFVYPVKVCKYCPEVHVGPSGHKVRMCGIFKYDSWKGLHMWKRAELDDLIPPRYVWHIREQDPTPLVDEGRGFYGHAPAIVELCVQAGAAITHKYHRGMKINDHLERSVDEA